MRAKARVNRKNAVPIERVRRYVDKLMALCERFVPREQHEAFARELRLLSGG